MNHKWTATQGRCSKILIFLHFVKRNDITCGKAHVKVYTVLIAEKMTIKAFIRIDQNSEVFPVITMKSEHGHSLLCRDKYSFCYICQEK